jgi:hypothetical protein
VLEAVVAMLGRRSRMVVVGMKTRLWDLEWGQFIFLDVKTRTHLRVRGGLERQTFLRHIHRRNSLGSRSDLQCSGCLDHSQEC